MREAQVAGEEPGVEQAERMICSSVCDVSLGGSKEGGGKEQRGRGRRCLRIVKKRNGNSTTMFRVCCAVLRCAVLLCSAYVCPLHSRAFEYPHSPRYPSLRAPTYNHPSLPHALSLPRSIVRSCLGLRSADRFLTRLDSAGQPHGEARRGTR